ncbi:EAL domain-containing protein [Mycolicibacterium sp. 120266]|uniref:sensor domain-containing phosphodiesterase n=1 Tax=Mycolicibacterium sp. 120266 TaxID=3090601 RepID=UPI00299EC556|nr:EAL domain-containing protein [Mycolicibacterium sp. 120266]MDX1874581.1 EAL domain-containing protein [Mycolicibacterium sp. 120266]
MKRLVDALTTSVDPASLMCRVAEQACAFMVNADGAAINLLRASDNAFVTVSASGVLSPALGFVIAMDHSLQGVAAQEKRPHLVDDALIDTRLAPKVRALNKQWGTRSWAVIPLIRNGAAMGSLMLAARARAAFTAKDIGPMVVVSDFVSALISSQSELSTLLTHAMNDDHKHAQGAFPARFVASLMVPEAVEAESHQIRLDELLAHPEALRVAFQPIVHLTSRKTIAYEGLARFPTLSELTPAQWFGTARRLGRGLDLEEAALHAVLAGAGNIQADCPIAVNLSPTAVLEERIQDFLIAQDRKLIIEITEHEPFPDDLAVGLKRLRERGMSLAVDDAGAGYASFTQLLRLRPDIIKIDGELTADIDNDPAKRAIATALTSLGAEMGAQIVAEAVETTGQLQTLIHLGVEYGQGFGLGRPEHAQKSCRRRLS